VTQNVLKLSLPTRNWIKSYKICFWGSSPVPKIVHPPHQECMPEKVFKLLPGHSVKKDLYCFYSSSFNINHYIAIW